MGRLNGKKDVRILLVGDPGVGKTSLIFSLVSEEFSEEVPPKAEEITIPPDVTPEKVNTQIVDFSAQEQNEENLSQEIRKANVICIVYAVDDDDSIDRITQYWLPLIRDQLGEEHNVPVVLVGNKVDLVEYSSLELILPIMNQFNEIETCVECSAKTLKNISELFYYAQKAVLHPTSPLYSSDDRDLTEKCKKALSRIFKLCDDDNDGVLNDTELNQFQRRCFNSPLQSQALEDVKNIVKRSVPDGIFDNGITLSGFLFLHCLFIQRGRHETTWTVLRKFGYNDKVELDEDYIHPQLDVPTGCSTELSITGLQFITQLFAKYDMNKDSMLSPSELSNTFSVCPSLPAYFTPDFYRHAVPTGENGWLTLNSFKSLWILMTYNDVRKTLELLAYLGYIESQDDNQLSAILVTRDKRIDLLKRQTTRTVFSCHVIGPQGAGKSSFLNGFISKTAKDLNDDRNKKTISELPRFAINTLKIYGQEKHLILREVDLFQVTDNLTEPELLCDVICLMYDCNNPRSFEYIAKIYTKHFKESKLPILVVSAKSDKNAVPQQYQLQPIEFCAKYKLPVPISFTVENTTTVKQEVYIKLGTMAAYPNLRRLVHALLMRPSTNWVSQHFTVFQNAFVSGTPALVKAGVGIATLAIVSIFIVRLVRSVNLQSNPR